MKIRESYIPHQVIHKTSTWSDQIAFICSPQVTHKTSGVVRWLRKVLHVYSETKRSHMQMEELGEERQQQNATKAMKFMSISHER